MHIPAIVFSLHLFRSPFHSFCSDRQTRQEHLPGTDVSPRGCFFRHSDIDPLYSYYYKRVTLLCSRSLHTRLLHSHRPFAVFAHRPKPGNTIIPKILLSLRFPRRLWKSTDRGFSGSPTSLSEIVSRASFSSGDFNSAPFPSSSYLHPSKPRRQRGRELSPEQFKTTWPCGMH